MKKVFITGIAGFLGSHVADEFIHQGYEVAGNDNLIGGYESFKNELDIGVKYKGHGFYTVIIENPAVALTFTVACVLPSKLLEPLVAFVLISAPIPL